MGITFYKNFLNTYRIRISLQRKSLVLDKLDLDSPPRTDNTYTLSFPTSIFLRYTRIKAPEGYYYYREVVATTDCGYSEVLDTQQITTDYLFCTCEQNCFEEFIQEETIFEKIAKLNLNKKT